MTGIDASGGHRSATGYVWLGAGVLTGAVLTAVVVTFALSRFGVSPLGPATAGAPGPARFVAETASAGIDHVYDGGFNFFVGGGVAVFDCDDDGRPDVYFAGGAGPAGLYRNESAPGGDLRFTAVGSPVTDLTDVTGAYPVDVDGDRITDLAVLRLGENVMLRGSGGCRFERANEAWSVDGGSEWTTAFGATWEGAAEWPTLVFGNYVALTDEGLQTSGECSDHALFRPAPGGDYAGAASMTPGWCTLSILFSDWDRSGRRDLRMTNDRHYYTDGEEQLWRVAAGDPPRPYTRDEGWQRMQIWGMGIASQDLDGDGRPEVFLTSQGDNKLQTLADPGAGRPTYDDIALAKGATAHRPFVGDDVMPSTAWHAEFQDVNNDTFPDLFIAKGNVDAMPDFAIDDPSNLLLGAPDGSFVDGAVEAGIVDFGNARGAALADLNDDGLLDLVVVNRRENVSLWRNVGAGTADAPQAMGSWLAVDLDQEGGNHDAIGAWIEVAAGERTVVREVTVGGGHAGGQLGPVHFGLGDADRARVRVQWPDGEFGPWLDVAADQVVVVERGAERGLDEPVPGSPDQVIACRRGATIRRRPGSSRTWWQKASWCGHVRRDGSRTPPRRPRLPLPGPSSLHPGFRR